MKPAWSDQFDAGRLPRVPVDLPGPVTPDWAWGAATGAGIRVAVIDSGVDAAHPDVGGVTSAVAFEHDPDAPGEVRQVAGPHEDLSGHGTACAAIIRRVAPEAEVHSVRVLGRNLRTRGIVFAAGLAWAVEQGMDVVNLSLSSRSADHLVRFHELADLAYFRGVAVVCAVNNVLAPSYPSQFASVFSVAAHEGKDPFGFDYNPNGPVEFGAPGIEVEVPWAEGRRLRVTGNSFAAPHLAGLLARIRSKHPTLTPSQLKALLQALARNAEPAVAGRS